MITKFKNLVSFSFSLSFFLFFSQMHSRRVIYLFIHNLVCWSVDPPNNSSCRHATLYVTMSACLSVGLQLLHFSGAERIVYRDLANEWGTPSRAEKRKNQGPNALFS